MAAVEYVSTVATAPATYACACACHVLRANWSTNEREQIKRDGTCSVLPRGVSKDLRLWGVLPREVELGRVFVWAFLGNIKGHLSFRTDRLLGADYFRLHLREPGKLHILHSPR